MIRALTPVVILVLWSSHLVGQRLATRLGNEVVLGPLLADFDTSDIRPPSIDRCTYPKAGIGYVRGRGLIGYSIDERGRADSLTVLSVEGLSREGLESIARRVLEACRFRPASMNGERLRGEVRQWLQFHSPDSLPYGTAEPYTPLHSTMMADSSAEFAVDAIDVDEKPRFKGCTKDLSTVNSAVFEVSYVIDVRGRGRRRPCGSTQRPMAHGRRKHRSLLRAVRTRQDAHAAVLYRLQSDMCSSSG
jgi:hypothetical protein